MKARIDWKEIASLRVVSKLGELIKRRFHTQLFGLSLQEEWFPLSPSATISLPWKDRTSFFQSAQQKLCFDKKDIARLSFCVGQEKSIVIAIGFENTLQGFIFAGPFIEQDKTSTQAENDSTFEAILWPMEIEYLTELIEVVALEVISYTRELWRKNEKEQLHSESRYPAICGRSRPMKTLFRLLDKVSETDSTVLIQGENGTGKELIARAIHENSARQQQRFVVQNCSAFNDNLLDSELFGHKKGAFTGAIADKQGLFEIADKGTFFLDEIGDMSPQLQVKVLRVLEEGTFLPVGETQPMQVDVRIIAATNRDLKKMVELGSFREDLYYRIHVLHVVAPPLRQRREDISVLVEFFLQKLAKKHEEKEKHLSRACLKRLLEYPWPGNVRELENEIERLWVLAGSAKLLDEDLLSPRILEKTQYEEASQGNIKLPGAIEELEKRMILTSLKKYRWNKTKAALELGVSRRNLIRKCQSYSFYPPPRYRK